MHLAESGVSICTRNVTMTGLRFLFRVTLRRLDLAAEIYHLREPQKIPLVISVNEAKRLLAVADSLKARAGDPTLLGGLLDFVMYDDALVLRMAETLEVKPEAFARARARLPGGRQGSGD